MYRLEESEVSRVREAVRAVYAVPFIDAIEDFVWEAIFSYVRGVPLVDPFNQTREKKLFDLVDPSTHRGWSAKTLDVPGTCRPGNSFELVIQRADIFSKGESLGFGSLTLDSPVERLGEAVLRHWLNKFDADSLSQGVTEARICVLLKLRGSRDRFLFYEDDLRRYEPSDLTWRWTNPAKKGIQGFRKADGVRVYRWYRSGAQLFECFTLPESIQLIDVPTSRLRPEDVIAMLSARLGKLP